MKQQYADSIAAVLRPLAPEGRLFDADVALINQLAGQWDARRPRAHPPKAAPPLPAQPIEAIRLTARTAAELVGHEAIVLEWYLDSEKVGTWGVGVTNSSGHGVDRYKDNPQTIGRCLEIYLWLLNTNYIPDVRDAFAGCKLTEAQFAAALSFHYNTGAIERTDWVKLFKAGKMQAARDFLETHYLNGGALTERRAKEAALFFDGEWSGDGTARVIPVSKPSYQPNFRRGERVQILGMLQTLLPTG
jgi:GH24 family phage-related lysozyme (muramidase)